MLYDTPRRPDLAGRLARGALAGVAAVMLAACGAGSHSSVNLTDSEKSFCSNLPHDALLANEEARQIVQKKHWDYDSDSLFADQLFNKASGVLGAFNPQTPELASRLKAARDNFLTAAINTDLGGAPDPSSQEVTAADSANRAFDDLQSFCSANS